VTTPTDLDPVDHARPEDAETHDAADPGTGRPAAGEPGAPRRLVRALPWVITAIAVAVAVLAIVQWRDLADREAAREDVAATASAFLVHLTTWDAGDGLDDTRTALEAAGTDDFRGEVDELFGGELGAALEEVEAASEGEVRDLFVQRIEGDEALVFAIVVQRVGADGEEQVTVRSARVLLERGADGWLVDQVDLVEDALVAPEAGS
jgi:hypothetical protein